MVVITLALGIGVNLTMLQTTYSFLARPLPFVDTGSEASGLLIALAMHHATQDVEAYDFSQADVLDLAARCTTCATVAAYDGHTAVLEQPGSRLAGGALRVHGQAVWPSLFQLLDTRAALGRVILPGEETDGAAAVVVLGHALWQRLGADPELVGRDVVLDGRTTTVVGVMPAGFRFPQRAEFWIPLTHRSGTARAERWIDNVAIRLRPGIRLAQAQTELDTFGHQLATAYPASNQSWSFRLRSYRDYLVGAELEHMLRLLLGAVAFVLLIACANVTNLLLARETHRRRINTLHRALGASRGHLVRQHLTESFVLAALGGALGLLFSVWAMDYLAHADPEGPPGWLVLEPGPETFAFAFGLTVVACLVFGLVPALRAAHPESGATTMVPGRVARGAQRAQRALVVGQIALALILLTGAGVAIKSAQAMMRIDAGFSTERLLTMRLDLARADDRATRVQTYDRVLERLAALPGIETVAATSAIPLLDDGTAIPLTFPGQVMRDGESTIARYILQTHDFLDVLQLPLIDGRGFTDAEMTHPDSRVVIVSEALARRLFAPGTAVGQRIQLGYDSDTSWSTIIGVVPTLYYEEPGEANEQTQLQAHLPMAWSPRRSMAIVARTSVPPDTLADTVRDTVLAIDSSIATTAVQSMHAVRRQGAWGTRLLSEMLGSFAFLALVIASLGIYGVMAFVVARRIPEIGIRMALGANRRAIRTLFLSRGLILIALGLALGTLGALALVGVLGSALYGVEPLEPRVLAAAATILGAVAALGVAWPSEQATRVRPIRALRQE